MKQRKEPAVVKVNGICGSGCERNGKRVKNEGATKNGKERDVQPVRDQGEGNMSAMKRSKMKKGQMDSMQLILGALMENQANVIAVILIK